MLDIPELQQRAGCSNRKRHFKTESLGSIARFVRTWLDMREEGVPGPPLIT